MPSIFELRPYPHHLPQAQELLNVLSEAFYKSSSANLIAARANLNTGQIFWEQPIFFVWKDVLERASAESKLRKLIEESAKLMGEENPSTSFLNDLLNDRRVEISGTAKRPDGSPIFIKNSDNVSEPEALLYRDDLTLHTGRIPALIDTLEILMKRATSVCRLSVDFNGEGQNGTAFRIGEQMLLTNWHVLYSRSNETKASTVTAEFLYEYDDKGIAVATKTFNCDVNSIVASKPNDWAIINILGVLDPEWEVVKLKNDIIPQVKGQAFIIQHPRGDRKRIGFIRNQISYVDDQVVQYLTDTDSGSSGAPVFDENGSLIAIHHVGGRPQEIAGRQPLKKNEGIRISKVLSDLQNLAIPGF